MAVLDLGKVVPEKGVDYFTNTDKQEIVNSTAQQIEEDLNFTETIEEINETLATKVDKNVNDLTNYLLKTDTGASLSLTIDSATYVMTLQLKNSDGTTLSTGTVDLPLETMVVNASYDSLTKEIVLTLKNGNTVRFSVASLVSGLQTEITENNKLSADLIETNNNKQFVSSSEKTTWSNKQDALTFDNTPTANSNNPVKSGGVYSYVNTIVGDIDSALDTINGEVVS